MRLLVVCLYRTPWRVQTERLDHAGLLQHDWRPETIGQLSESLFFSTLQGCSSCWQGHQQAPLNYFRFMKLRFKNYSQVSLLHTHLWWCGLPHGMFMWFCVILSELILFNRTLVDSFTHRRRFSCLTSCSEEFPGVSDDLLRPLLGTINDRATILDYIWK